MWVIFVVFLSVQEFMTFTSQLIVERSAKGSRASVKEQGKGACHPARGGGPAPLLAALSVLLPHAHESLSHRRLARQLSIAPELGLPYDRV